MLSAIVIAIDQGAGHGDLEFRVFGERNPHGIAYTIFQECADAGGRFYATVFALACFGDTEVQGVVHVLLMHPHDECTVGLHHHLGIAGFHTEHDVVETFSFCDAQKFQGRFHHAESRIAVAAHDPITQRPVVGAYTQCGSVFLADFQQWNEALTDAVQLFSIGGIVVIDHFKLFPVGKITRIDADLLHDPRCHFGGVGGEMDVRHQRRGISPLPEFSADILQILRLVDTGSGDTDQFTPCFNHSHGLFHRSRGIHGIRGGHTLYPDRMFTTHP